MTSRLFVATRALPALIAIVPLSLMHVFGADLPPPAATSQPNLTLIGTNSPAAPLQFNDFFKSPVGPRGLEYSDKLRALEGKRVAIVGYMVEQEDPPHGRFLLAPMAQTLHDHEYGLADDLPAATIFVQMPAAQRSLPVAFHPGRIRVAGILRLGNRDEPDGRISTVRLEVDSPAASQPVPQNNPSTQTQPAEAGSRGRIVSHSH